MRGALKLLNTPGSVGITSDLHLMGTKGQLFFSELAVQEWFGHMVLAQDSHHTYTPPQPTHGP